MTRHIVWMPREALSASWLIIILTPAELTWNVFHFVKCTLRGAVPRVMDLHHWLELFFVHECSCTFYFVSGVVGTVSEILSAIRNKICDPVNKYIMSTPGHLCNQIPADEEDAAVKPNRCFKDDPLLSLGTTEGAMGH